MLNPQTHRTTHRPMSGIYDLHIMNGCLKDQSPLQRNRHGDHGLLRFKLLIDGFSNLRLAHITRASYKCAINELVLS